MDSAENKAGTASPALTRRKALARLGLGAAVAYVAPTIVHLDRSANAKVQPTPCVPGNKGKGKGGGRSCPPD